MLTELEEAYELLYERLLEKRGYNEFTIIPSFWSLKLHLSLKQFI